jgi:predicted DNA-binding transcriptional regulator AlpA
MDALPIDLPERKVTAFYTVPELATMLRKSESTVYRWSSEAQLGKPTVGPRFTKIGGRLVVSDVDLQAYLDRARLAG